MKSLLEKWNWLRTQSLYDSRKLLMKENGERNRFTISLGLFLAVSALAMLLMASWVPTNHDSYIEQQANLHSIKDAQWYRSEFFTGSCGIDLGCYDSLLTMEKTSLVEIDALGNRGKQTKHLVLSYVIPRETLQKLKSEPTVHISLPMFRYERAATFYQGKQLARYFRGERINLLLESSEINSKLDLELVTILEVLPSDRTLAGVRDHAGLLVSGQYEYAQFEKYLHHTSSGAVGSMGAVAKVVLALFCVLMFLIVDSSPESLGLSLFMGFEALAIGIGRGWIPLGWIGFERDLILTNFCYQMGDILKVYFFLQLARIGRPNVWPWVIIGVCLSVPYGFFMEYAYEHSFTWQYKIPRTRDTLAGFIGFLACANALYLIRTQSLPWRKSALALGILAAFVEISKSWLTHSDISRIYPLVTTTYALLEANLGYIFALSTFLNISTLENRVRTLTTEKEKANEIKRQMELGQSLQRAFLTLPKLPENISLTCFHEAAVYVSGDTYFVHWDQGRQTVTFLLNDVTGFGVQAALKAFAGNVIARTIWVDSAEDIRRKSDRRKQETNLEKYDKLVDELLCRNANEKTDDFNAMIGAEFNVKTGELELYRANYNFPYIVLPEFEWQDYEEGSINLWNFEKVQLKNRETYKTQLKPGAFILFVSDGYIENSRAELSFMRSVKKEVAATRKKLTSTMLQSLALKWAEENGKNLHSDDRTVMVMQWIPEAVEKTLEKPKEDMTEAI